MPAPALPLVSIGGLLAVLVAVTIFAGPLQRHLVATADQLFAPGPYISTVLETPGKKIEYHGHADDHGDDPDDDHGETSDEAAHGEDAGHGDAQSGEDH